jgi:hypothetical protein
MLRSYDLMSNAERLNVNLISPPLAGIRCKVRLRQVGCDVYSFGRVDTKFVAVFKRRQFLMKSFEDILFVLLSLCQHPSKDDKAKR